MKVSSLSLIVSTSIVSLVSAFADTSSFYSSTSLGKQKYITESSGLSELIEAVSNDVCSNKDEKMIIYRVSNLSPGVSRDEGTYIKHVHYNSISELDLSIGSACGNDKVKYSINEVPEENDASILIVDVEDNKKHSIDEFLNASTPHVHVVVQGKPSFHKPGSKIESLKHYIEDKAYENMNVDIDLDGFLSKRETATEDEEEFNKLIEEVEEDFKAAESFIAAESSEIFVSALETPSPTKQPSDAGSNRVGTSNLFTNYQFFTPGLWMCILVSGLLIFILYIALRWMTSLQISYKAFDKQIDFQKKTE